MALGQAITFLLNQMRSATGDLGSGTVEFYAAGTTTPKDVYHDRALTSVAANPYTLTADGTAELFGYGVYRIVFKNTSDVTVYDFDDVAIFPSSFESMESGAETIALDATSGNVSQQITLGVAEVTGYRLDATANTAIITPPVGYTIEGAASYGLTAQYETVQLYWPGSGTVYYVI